MEAPIIRTCKAFFAGAALIGLLAAPAVAAKPVRLSASDALTAYVSARGAEIGGDNARSARLYVDLAMADLTNTPVARRAIATAIQAGETDLAVSLAQRMPVAELGFDGRLLLVADALRSGRGNAGLALLQSGKTTTETDLLAPLVRAWLETTAGKPTGIASMAAIPEDNPLYATSGFQRASMLLAQKRVDEALPLARKILEGRTDGVTRQRLALATGFARVGRKDVAREMLQGNDGPLEAARSLMAQGKSLPSSLALDDAAKGLAELLMSLAAELGRNDQGGLPLSLARIAGHANPNSVAPKILSALFLDNADQTPQALATLRSVKPDDVLAGDAMDLEARTLSRANRNAEALQRVQASAASPTATTEEIGRYADVLGELKRHDEAAAAYGRAIERAKAEGVTTNLWTLHLLRAASLEEVNRWDEAKAELQTALILQPDNPVVLNYLGYGKLERGEDLDAAEAMIRKASAMRPDDASITDSLGWALYKRGNLPEAIETLRRAAAGDPAQSEIHEHLGDALFKSGRRIEARFAWNAALVTADGEAKPRLQTKLDTGLSSSNAAP